MPARISDVDWDMVRTEYEVGIEPVRVIAERHGVTRSAVNNRRGRHGWRPRRLGQTNTASMVRRMYVLADRQLVMLEDLKQPADEAGVRLLSQLARTIEKLKELEIQESASNDGRQPDGDIAEFRRQLAQRLEALAGGEAE